MFVLQAVHAVNSNLEFSEVTVNYHLKREETIPSVAALHFKVCFFYINRGSEGKPFGLFWAWRRFPSLVPLIPFWVISKAIQIPNVSCGICFSTVSHQVLRSPPPFCSWLLEAGKRLSWYLGIKSKVLIAALHPLLWEAEPWNLNARVLAMSTDEIPTAWDTW